jgi:hypothetical protein
MLQNFVWIFTIRQFIQNIQKQWSEIHAGRVMEWNALSEAVLTTILQKIYELAGAISPEPKTGWILIRRFQKVFGGIPIVNMSGSEWYANMTNQI